MNLEEKLATLEGIVKKLDDKELTVTESIDLFQEGIRLSKETLTALKETRGKLEALNFEIDKLAEELKTV